MRMGIKILSSQNQISLPEAEDSGAALHKKMAAAAAISIANSGMMSRNKIVRSLQSLGSPAMAAFSFIHSTLIKQKINIIFC